MILTVITVLGNYFRRANISPSKTFLKKHVLTNGNTKMQLFL